MLSEFDISSLRMEWIYEIPDKYNLDCGLSVNYRSYLKNNSPAQSLHQYFSASGCRLDVSSYEQVLTVKSQAGFVESMTPYLVETVTPNPVDPMAPNPSLSG